MSDYQQQAQILEQLARIVNIIDRVRAGTTTIDDAEFLECELAIPNNMRGQEYGQK